MLYAVQATDILVCCSHNPDYGLIFLSHSRVPIVSLAEQFVLIIHSH